MMSRNHRMDDTPSLSIYTLPEWYVYFYLKILRKPLLPFFL